MLEIAKEWAILFPLSILVADMEASGIVTVVTLYYLLLQSLFQTQCWLNDLCAPLEQRQMEMPLSVQNFNTQGAKICISTHVM